MTWRQGVAVCLLASMLGPPFPAAAQVSSSQADQWHAVVSQLEPAAFVSVRLKDGTRLKGTLLAVQDASFTLQVRTRIPVAPRNVNYADVTMLERSKVGMNPAVKVLIGVGVGFAALMATLAAMFAGD